jgi:hypothetical protein
MRTIILKKLNFVLYIFILLASSCAMPKYTDVYRSSPNLDLRGGKWLINYVDGNISLFQEQNIARKIKDGFQDMGVDSIFLVSELIFPYITPDKFTSELSKETLDILKMTTDFTYLISVTSTKIKNELNGLMISAPDKESQSTAELLIKVFEIKTGDIIYHHLIIASVTMDETYHDYTFAKSAEGLINGALKRALRKIDKNSIKNN